MPIDEEIKTHNKDNEMELESPAKKITSKNSKISGANTKDLVFHVRIYMVTIEFELELNKSFFQMPNKRDHFVDIRLKKGHPIIFLEFCNHFFTSLGKSVANLD